MKNHYLLSATGQDHPGFVSNITKILFELHCNLEDSSMMRLGSEFGMFIIFSSDQSLNVKNFSTLRDGPDLSLNLKKITSKQAQFVPAKRESYIVRVHGQDKPGIVFHLTQCLAKHGFNITDLSTHRTTQGRLPGYIVLLEGELLETNHLKPLQRDLVRMAKRLKTHISIGPISTQSL